MDEQPDVDGERDGTVVSLAADVEVTVRRGVAESERLPVELGDTDDERHNEGVGDTDEEIVTDLLTTPLNDESLLNDALPVAVGEALSES